MLVGRSPFTNKNKHKVLKDVLEAPILMKKSFSEEARDLLTKLLERDPKRRLGHSDRDALDIMEHPFFSSIDWDKLAVKDFKPPYIPKVKRIDDLRHIDPLFKEEKVEDTPTAGGLRLSEKERNHFKEFTYCKDGQFTQDVQYNSDDDNDLSQILEEDDYDGPGHISEGF